MDDHERAAVPRQGDERATLSGFLQFQRDTLAWKCAGLTPEQLRLKAVPPSNLTLLGLLRHMAEGERAWFRNAVNGESAPRHWQTPTGEPAEFDVDDADADEAYELWRQECARSRAIVDAAESLDVVGHYEGHVLSLRWILTHVIEDYARHNGHADFLRERIDGSTGE